MRRMQADIASPRTLLRHTPFTLYFLGRVFSEFAYQISAVAIGWQIYALTHSAFALGMVGLAQFLPTLFLTFAAGHVADRHDRRRIVQLCQLVEAGAALFLALGSFGGWLTVPEIFAAVVVFGTATAFESPAAAALLPAVVPDGMLQRGTALSTGAFQVAIISGPALGGLTYALGSWVPYAIMAAFWLLGMIVTAAIRLDRPIRPSQEPASWSTMFAGAAFVLRNPAILGTISLDLFAVLLGGATALMPIYAADILHTGAWGLGILRGAPAIGALAISIVLARRPIETRTGLRMFQAVILFGLGTIIFAVSRDIWLSLAALVFMGAADTVSMVIRISLVQLATPDAMRGRVSAVNFLFVNASNQLGEFRAGVAAALMGTVPAALMGGIGTVAVALLWMRLFPALKDWDRLE
jgi:MFS family permease